MRIRDNEGELLFGLAGQAGSVLGNRKSHAEYETKLCLD
jgi:hypothetical protein